MSQNLNKKELAYLKYIDEAKKYFVTEFLESDKLKEGITKALDVILNLDNDFSGKGLMLFSKSFGQGKTFFFEIVYNRILRFTKVKPWKSTTAKDLRAIYTTKGIEALDNEIRCKNLFIDDLGEEEETGKNFGDEMNVLRYVILKRYEMFVRNNCKLHLTTNLTIKEIAEKYDPKVADRLLGMTEKVEFDFLNGSFRQVKTARRLTEDEKKKTAVKKEEIKYNDKEYFEFLEEMAIDFRNKREVIGKHWIDFWVMFHFFERKGLKMREVEENDIKAAEAVIKADRLNNKSNRIDLKESKERINNKNKDQIKDAALSVIAKEYFVKLALSKYTFCETSNLSEL